MSSSAPSRIESHAGSHVAAARLSILIVLLTAFTTRPCNSAELYVGGESVSITPDQPVSLTGQMHTRIARKVESEVTASVLALESRDGDQVLDQAVLVSCDLVAIRGGLLGEVRERLRERSDEVDVNKVILSATHTHTGPTLVEGRYNLPADGVMRPEAFVEFAADRIVGAVINAWQSRKPGSAGWGLGGAVIAQNRRAVYSDGRAVMYGATVAADFRGIEGHEDHGVEVLFFWNSDDELIATAINIACPSQEVEGRSAVNADFWHPVRQTLKAKYGKELVVLAWTGAAGDHAPRPMYRRKAEERMRRLRGLTRLEELARRVVVGWEEAYEGGRQEKIADPVLKHQVRTIELPLRKVTEAEFIASQRKVADWSKNPANQRRAKWEQEVVNRYERQQAGTERPYQMELHAIRLGDVAIATNDFELFTDFGVQMKSRSPALQTFVIQLCGPGTYVPSARAERGGGYSAIVQSNVVGSEGGQVLTDRTVETLKQLWSDR